MAHTTLHLNHSDSECKLSANKRARRHIIKAILGLGNVYYHLHSDVYSSYRNLPYSARGVEETMVRDYINRNSRTASIRRSQCEDIVVPSFGGVSAKARNDRQELQSQKEEAAVLPVLRFTR